MEEVWKHLKEYPNYMISNLSNFRRIKSDGSTKVIKKFPNPEGYMFVYLYQNGIRSTVAVHRLVAKYFVSNPNNFQYVNHKDESKNNDIATNLEWCSSSYNRKYGTTENRRTFALSDRFGVGQYTKDGKLVKVYQSASIAARTFGKIHSCHITNCCRNKKPTAYGFKWKKINYKDYLSNKEKYQYL